jgi:hypothetical protein
MDMMVYPSNLATFLFGSAIVTWIVCADENGHWQEHMS